MAIKKIDLLRYLLVLICLLALSCWIYREGQVALPRGDYLSYLRERTLRDSDWEFFLDSLSYNRTRRLDVGDYYLFHPGMFFILAMNEIFFSHDFRILGVLSILIHGFTAFSLYLLVSRWLGFIFAIPPALILLFQYSGMEMILWRHPSPYMLSLFFFGLALWTLSQFDRREDKKNLFSLSCVFFFLSTLFNSLPVISLSLCALWFAAVKPDPRIAADEGTKGEFPGRKFLVLLCFVPAFLYLTIDLIDVLYYHPPEFWGPRDMRPSAGRWFDFFPRLIFLSGLFFTAFALTPLVRMTVVEPWGRYQWDFTAFPDLFFYLGGLFLMVLLVWVMLSSNKEYCKEGDRIRGMVLIFLGAYVATLLGSVCFLRLLTRGSGYLLNSTYYYYLDNYSLLAVASLVASRGRNFIRNGPKRTRIFLFLFSLPLLGFLLVFNYRAIQDFLKSHTPFDKIVAKGVAQITSAVKKNRRFCYGGELENFGLGRPGFFYPYTCRDTRHTALYLWPEAQKRFYLVRFKRIPVRPVSLDLEGPRIVLSKERYDPVLLEADLHHGFEGGLIAGYKDPKNFVVFLVREDQFYILLIEKGASSPPQYQRALDDLARQEVLRMSIRKIGSNYAVFCNQRVLAILGNEIPSLTGRVGLYDFRGGQKRRAFSRIVIAEEGKDDPFVLQVPLNL